MAVGLPWCRSTHVRQGWDLADSIVVNPHKTVFVPLDFSVLYVRDLARLQRVFSLVPEYLRGDTIEAERTTWIMASSSAAGSVP